MILDRQATATMLVVTGGVVLAGLLAALVSVFMPARQTTVAAASIASPIDFAVLDRGANLADLERGRVYYAQLCISCHGARGDGHGEWAYRVTPHPGDLTSARVQQRSDAYLFSVISDGQVGTPMMGWKQRLSEQQRWQIVDYLRHLGVQQIQDRRVGS